jgi:hypothetical protein
MAEIKIQVPQISYKNAIIEGDIPDLLILSDHYAESKWKFRMTTKNEDTGLDETFSYQGATVIPKEKICMIDAGWETKKEAFQCVIAGQIQGHEMVFILPSMKEAVDMKEKIKQWLFNGK